MRVIHLIPLLASLAISAPAPYKADTVSYDGFKVLRINTRGHQSAIKDKLSSISYEQWNDDVYKHIDIIIPPSQVAAFEALGLDYRVMHEDLGDSIAAESASRSVWSRQTEDPSWFDSYHDYEDHIQYFNDLQASFPNNSEVISSGTSYEGRDLYGLHIWGSSGPGKPAVLYHGNVHAREWITSPVVEYITLQLITGYKNGDDLISSFLDKYDFYIIPIVNPDGFVYSQTTNRLWRKNRQPPPSSSPANQSCIGRDINRNWEFAWDANPQGASTNPCSEAYKGGAPSDAPENQGLDKLARQLRDGAGIKLFIDWHSYGQYILSPFGYKETLYAPELGKWTKAAGVVSETIRDSSDARTTFTFGPSGAVLYATTGAAPDHLYSIGRAEFSYTIELRDTGDFGFVLPPELIRPTAEEQWEGQKALLGLLDETFFDGEGPA
ncbi:hypothetical protein M426DRAFT_50647 [Hypoxylon sp. CI-4A]|nr:hypothetical protein M426DRAFT_50647 [Hypoxylon sp. CI-4A]